MTLPNPVYRPAKAGNLSENGGVFMTAWVDLLNFVAFGAYANGSDQAVLQIGRCQSQEANTFRAPIEINTATGQITVNSVNLVVP